MKGELNAAFQDTGNAFLINSVDLKMKYND